MPRHHRLLLAALLLAAAGAGCTPAPDAAGAMSGREREAVARAVEQRLRAATDLRAGGDVVARMLDIYPDSGRVVSATAGEVTTTRDSLARALAFFWESVGQNMQNPEWRWGRMHVDVLGPDAAVVTATYRIPHLTPRGVPHVIGGAWTAVFARRGGDWGVVQEHLSDVEGTVGPVP